MSGDTACTIQIRIDPERQGEYFTIPLEIPENTAALRLSYRYQRRTGGEVVNLPFQPQEEINIIDLGLIDPHGRQVGASGSDKTEIFVSENAATPGYKPTRLVPGEWQILVGAYKVAREGVEVTYEARFTPKAGRWLKGDLHMHTFASDGVHSAHELAAKAMRHGLDFIAVTDHNQMSTSEGLSRVEGLTLIPGVEWTHYKGHANFLGIDRPYDGSFAANSADEIETIFASARERGALIVLNHPFEEGMGFALDFNRLPFDCLEVWNGPMRESNLRALGLWQNLLAAGKRIPICGGSDYHRDTPFIFLGGPTTHVYAQSDGASDILAALKQGRSYITFAPNGPRLEFGAGEGVMMGDTAAWKKGLILHIQMEGLNKGDIVRLVNQNGAEDLLEAPAPGRFEMEKEVLGPGFYRVEVQRYFLPGVPRLPALVSNPVYISAA